MKEIFDIIKINPLFNGISFDEFEKIFYCIGARKESYKKNDIIVLSGNRIDFIGIVLLGSVKVIKEDINGNISILTELTKAELFAETFVCAGILHSPVTIQSSENSEILFINYNKIINICSAGCIFHTKLIENMLKLLAHKNLMLNQKIDILSKRTTREKLLLFFETQRGMEKKFKIPYNREELAHYLCVDRSAMSNELCKMRNEKLIKFKKNEFEIL